MANVLLAGVLGAAVLAIVLLYRSYTRHEAIITQLRAEVAAEKIARLTQGLEATAPFDEDELRPVRRKRHLALYIGGGVAAVLASLGRRLRSPFSSSPRAVVAATVTVVAVAGTATAFIMGTTSNNAPAPEGPRSSHPASAPDSAVQDANGTDAGVNDEAARANIADGSPLIDTSSPTTDHAPSPETPPDADTTPSADTSNNRATPDATPTNAAPPADDSDDEGGTASGTAPANSAAAPPPVAPPPDPPSAAPAPDPQPSEPEDDEDSHGLVCVKAPRLLYLCLLGKE